MVLCNIFEDAQLSERRRLGVRKAAEGVYGPSVKFVECKDGFIAAWNTIPVGAEELSYYITENDLSSADLCYAVFCANVPSLSFAEIDLHAMLLISSDGGSDNELVRFFFEDKKEGSCFVVDGGDGAGKETQSQLLKAKLSENRNVHQIAFPNYGGFCGSALRDVLFQRSGPTVKLHPLSLSFMFTMNRLSKRSELNWAKRLGCAMLLDRYYTSNFGYQASKVPISERERLLQYLDDVEVVFLQLPRPLMVLYLDISPQHAMTAMLNDVKRPLLDANELANIHDKEKIRDVFKHCCCSHQNWHLIDSCREDGTRHSADVVHGMIYTKVIMTGR